jgi:hypothetical protein
MNFQLSPYTTARTIEGVSVTAAGRIGLPKLFLTTYHITPHMKVNLYWDADVRTMAMAFTQRADATAFPIVFTQSCAAFISARRFFQVHNLDTNAQAGRYSYSRHDGAAVGIPEAGPRVFLVQLDGRSR